MNTAETNETKLKEKKSVYFSLFKSLRLAWESRLT